MRFLVIGDTKITNLLGLYQLYPGMCVRSILYLCPKRMKPIVTWGFALFGGLLFAACTPAVDLSGTWDFCLDAEGTVAPDAVFDDSIVLPGTTDLAALGVSRR